MSENIEKTLRFVKESFEGSPWFAENPAEGMYRLEHTLRVARIGEKIAEDEGLDREALIIACLLHDIAYSNLIPAGGWNEHGRVGAAMARPFLQSLGLEKEKVEEICYGIAIHVDDAADFEGVRSPLALSVGDADSIDRFGVFRIYDAMRYAGFYEMKLEEKLEWSVNRVRALKRLYSIDFATETAKKLWLENLEYQIDYFGRLQQQLEDSRIPEEF